MKTHETNIKDEPNLIVVEGAFDNGSPAWSKTHMPIIIVESNIIDKPNIIDGEAWSKTHEPNIIDRPNIIDESNIVDDSNIIEEPNIIDWLDIIDKPGSTNKSD